MPTNRYRYTTAQLKVNTRTIVIETVIGHKIEDK